MVAIVILKYCVKGQESADRFYTALQALENVEVRMVSPVEFQPNEDDVKATDRVLSDSSRFSLLLITSERSLQRVNSSILKTHWSKLPVFCLGRKIANEVKNILGSTAKVESFLRTADLSKLLAGQKDKRPILVLCGCAVPSTVAKTLESADISYESVTTYSSKPSLSIIADSFEGGLPVEYIVVFSPADAHNLIAEIKDSSKPDLDKLRFLTLGSATTNALSEEGISFKRIFQSQDPTPEALSDTLLDAMQMLSEGPSDEENNAEEESSKTQENPVEET